jgi:hypothetical protein
LHRDCPYVSKTAISQGFRGTPMGTGEVGIPSWIPMVCAVTLGDGVELADRT